MSKLRNFPLGTDVMTLNYLNLGHKLSNIILMDGARCALSSLLSNEPYHRLAHKDNENLLPNLNISSARALLALFDVSARIRSEQS